MLAEDDDKRTKSAELWFEDGNIVLQAETTLFRVYRGVLKVRSSVFADMLALPQPDVQETYEGCPLVVLQDRARDLQCFLEALFDMTMFYTGSKPNYLQVAAWCRLGTKYDVPSIRQYAIQKLRAAYPTTLEEYDVAIKHLREGSPEAPFVDIPGSAFETVNISFQLGIPEIIKASVCLATGHTPSEILHGISSKEHGVHFELDSQFKAQCLEAREILSAGKATVITILSNTTSWALVDCKSPEKCSRHRWMLISCSFACRAHIFGMKWGGPWGAEYPLCSSCDIEASKKFQETRQELWKSVPDDGWVY